MDCLFATPNFWNMNISCPRFGVAVALAILKKFTHSFIIYKYTNLYMDNM